VRDSGRGDNGSTRGRVRRRVGQRAGDHPSPWRCLFRLR